MEDFGPARVVAQVPILKGLVGQADVSRQLNEVLHHPDFQRLEATWRGLHYLVHQTETVRTSKSAC